MLIKTAVDIRYSEITPKDIYINRRRFLAGVPAAFLGARARLAGTTLPNTKSAFSTVEKQNSYQDVSTYNNYYEFGTDKSEPARVRQELQDRALDGQRGRRRAPSRASSAWKRSWRWRRWKSASTGIAAWRPGRSWCRGSAIR